MAAAEAGWSYGHKGTGSAQKDIPDTWYQRDPSGLVCWAESHGDGWEIWVLTTSANSIV
jgi:hypothetical protein